MDRPLNVLWILCDELRADAVACFGGAPVAVSTPAIDGLADRGVLFERCYAASPVCVPARVGMHTGLLPEETGVYGNEAFWPGHQMGPIETFPEVLARQGWATADFGKEHIPRALTPWQLQDHRGSLAHEVMRALPDDAAEVLRSTTGLALAGRFPAEVPYPPSVVVDNVLGWVRQAPEPFLVRASLLQPHTPVVPPEPWATLYEGRDWPDEVVQDPTASAFERRFGEVSGGLDLSPAEIVRAQVAYHGLVAWVDAEIGRLLAGLAAIGKQAARTVVVFTSDHGRLLGEQGGIGKHTHAPAAQRIPLIVVHPDLSPGRRHDLASQVDLARTFCGLVDAAPPPRAGGRDLFRDPPPGHVSSTIGYGQAQSAAFPNLGIGRWFGDRGWPRRTCVRTERWRYDRNVRLDGAPPGVPDRDDFMADTTVDPNEATNRVGDPSVAGVLAELSALVDDLAGRATDVPAAGVYGSSP